MPGSPPASAGPQQPKTLAEARNVIQSLRAQLSAPQPKIPGGKEPVPKVDPQPVAHPDPSKPGMPGTMDLGALAPKQLSEFIDCCSTAVLKKLLGLETGKGSKQDSRVVQQLYRELKKRGA